MKIFVLILICQISLLEARYRGRPLLDIGKRIANGTEAKLEDWPFIVSMYNYAKSSNNEYQPSPSTQWCTGALIEQDIVLIAAHCLKGDNEYKQKRIAYNSLNDVLLKDDPNATKCIIDDFVYHEAFNKTTYEADIAVMLIGECDKDTPRPTIQLATFDDLPELNSEINVTAAGWGETEHGDTVVLHEGTYHLIPPQQCRDIYASYDEPDFIVHETDICMLSPMHGTCEGDSGGPLVYINETTGQKLLIGALSRGLSSCDDHRGYLGGEWKSKFPDAYALVPAYYDWIQEHIKVMRKQKGDASNNSDDGNVETTTERAETKERFEKWIDCVNEWRPMEECDALLQ